MNPNLSPIHILSNGSPINVVSSTKFLGVIIGNKLDFKEHIQTLGKKIARSVGILSKIRHIFPFKTLLQLYHALIHPLLTYGILIWGSTYSTYLSKLKTLQNKAMRSISGSHYCEDPLVCYIRNSEVLKIQDWYRYETAKCVYSCINNQVPSLFNNYFQRVNEVSQRSTRQSVNKLSLYIPRYPTTKLQRSIRYQGVNIWNSIPTEIKSLNLQLFKTVSKHCFCPSMTNKFN